MKIFYDERYVGAAHSFDTTRKAQLVAEAAADMPGVEICSPQEATQRELAMIHDPAYVRAVLTGKGKRRSSAGFPWDEGYAKAVAASTGGAVEAALAALRDGVAGSLSSGLHHATTDSGAGFCTFNGLALAAKVALGGRPTDGFIRKLVKRRCKKVLILDLDAHCGGGTFDIIKDDERIYQIDISVCSFDSYHGGDPERHHLHVIRHAQDYLPILELELERAAEIGFDLVIYNSGMDPHEDCNIGGLPGISSDIIRLRERMVFDWARARGIPVAFVLAGGYTGGDMWDERLTALHQMTVAAATQGKMPDMEAIEGDRVYRAEVVGFEDPESLQEELWEEFNREAAHELSRDRTADVEPWGAYAADGGYYGEEPEVKEYKSIHELPQEFFEIGNEDLRAQYPEFFE